MYKSVMLRLIITIAIMGLAFSGMAFQAGA